GPHLYQRLFSRRTPSGCCLQTK
ncbi:hypothetical protein V3C99_002929, partial [Haemonchus contortus]